MMIAELAGATFSSSDFERDGYEVIEQVVPVDVIERLKAAIADLSDREEVRRRGGVFGVRNMLEILPEARELATLPEVRAVVEPILGPRAFAVRGTLFDKNAEANWKLFWHQDSVITVREPVEAEGFGGFARKAGVWHVQPPTQVLDRMLAVRVHLDDCDENNGPLRVLPGSHRSGWVDEDLESWKRDVAPVTCVVKAGGCLLMRPLILHASSAALVPRHRRVVHLEYAADDLPGGLEWHSRYS